METENSGNLTMKDILEVTRNHRSRSEKSQAGLDGPREPIPHVSPVIATSVRLGQKA